MVVGGMSVCMLICIFRRLRRVERATESVAVEQRTGMQRTMRNVLSVKRQMVVGMTIGRTPVQPTMQTSSDPRPRAVSWLENEMGHVETQERVEVPGDMSVDEMETSADANPSFETSLLQPH